MLIDTHCHLDAAEFDADRERVRAAARAAGVRWMVLPAVERAAFAGVARLCAQSEGCVYALGIHPMYVDRATEDDLVVLRAEVERAMSDPRFVAIGEIGLDFFVDGHDRARQERFFAAQLAIAREFDLPVLMHVRRAQDIVLAHLRRRTPPGGIAHAFNGSRAQAERFLALGCVLGVGGAMTYRRALRIRALAGSLPETALVLETDAPDIPPEWIHRGRNAPAELPRIARALADLRGQSLDAVVADCGRNALRVLPRLALLAGQG
jgi:TatD DNase family protein